MPVRGVRGAVVAAEDRSEAVLSATKELLLAILKANPDLVIEDLASAWFTVSDDIRSVYPAKAAREIGWSSVPLMCSQEIPVSGSLPRCIRVLLSWNTELSQKSIHHVYLGAAASLRPDLDQSK
ncbi:MAG: chorismate mutase [Anaerolineaceae bacterium]|nr:chorismate mutase [Anaerolineaceae bacterium]